MALFIKHGEACFDLFYTFTKIIFKKIVCEHKTSECTPLFFQNFGCFEIYSWANGCMISAAFARDSYQTLPAHVARARKETMINSRRRMM
jgi:hypothetical protein